MKGTTGSFEKWSVINVSFYSKYKGQRFLPHARVTKCFQRRNSDCQQSRHLMCSVSSDRQITVGLVFLLLDKCAATVAGERVIDAKVLSSSVQGLETS